MNYVVIDVDLNTKQFDQQIDKVKDELFLIDEKLSHAQELKLNDTDIVNLRREAEKLNNKLYDLNKQKDKFNQTDFNGIQGQLGNIGKTTESIIRKVTKWGLALFSIRSAYSFIRSAVSTLSQSNEQIGTNIEYIRWSLAQALLPVVNTIINLAYQLLGVINAISMAVFNYNLFANATVEAFQKQQKALKGSNKTANELKKTLAGFDEMNIIQDSGSVASGGGGGGITLPSPIPDTKDMANDIKSFFKNIDQFWTNDWEELFGSVQGYWDAFIYGLGLTFKGFYDVISGIGEMIIGIFKTIIDIVTGNMDGLKEDFGIFIDGLTKLIKGAFEMITGILGTLLGFVKGVIMEVWETIVGILGGIANWVNNTIIKPVTNFFGNMWNKVITGASGAWNGIKRAFSSVATFFYNTFSTAWNGVKKLFTVGGKIFDGMKEGIVNVFVAIVNALISGINKVISKPFDLLNGILNAIKDIDILGFKPFDGFWSRNPIPVPKIPTIQLAKGGIINYPGAGIPIGGERGAEGVIPLTDSQQMNLLGKAIADNMSFTATIPVYVGNRMVAREIRQINANSDFAFNR